MRGINKHVKGTGTHTNREGVTVRGTCTHRTERESVGEVLVLDLKQLFILID